MCILWPKTSFKSYKLYLRGRVGTVFFFSRKSSFFGIFEEYRMNEWKSCFFFRGCVFFFRPRNWMNEWHVNFSRKKKTQKNTHSSWKKKHNQLLLKKRNFIKIWLNDRWTFQEKNPPKKSGKKHNQLFIEKNRNSSKFRMNDRWTFPGKKNTTNFYSKNRDSFKIRMNDQWTFLGK